MTLVTTTIADDDAPSPAMGDLGKFRIKKLKKLVKPLMSIAKPLLSMGHCGGLLTAMGPWGWAAGAALAAGGALAAKHRKKKQKAKQRQAEQAAMEPPQSMPAPAYEYPPAITEQPAEAMPMPDGYSAPSSDMPGPGAMTLPESPPAEWSLPGIDVATPYPVAEQSPEIQAVLDPEMPPSAVDGLAADGQPTVPLDWQTIAFIAGLGLGGWWLLSNLKPTRTKRR